MSSSVSDSGDEVPPARLVEYYDTTVELSAAIILRQAAGWELLSAGHVSAGKLWGEFQQTFPDIPDDAGV